MTCRAGAVLRVSGRGHFPRGKTGQKPVRAAGGSIPGESVRKMKTTSVLFVCHGNICRSPMAEFVMKDLVRKAGLESRFRVASAATSDEETGSPVYPPARRLLAAHGIDCSGKTARRLNRADYGAYDLLIGMDKANLRNMRRILLAPGEDGAGKLCLLRDFTDRPGDIADPWYTGDFEAAWRDVLEGCEGLLERLAGQ